MADRDDELFPVQLEPHLEVDEPVTVHAIWGDHLPAKVVGTRGAMVWVRFDASGEQAIVMRTSVERAPAD